MELISESTLKARKEHVCMWCNGKIKKGEVYNETVIKNDYIYRWKNHLKCSDLYHKLKMYDCDAEGVDGDTFMEYVYQFLYEKLSEEEHDGLFGEDAVNKVVELLESW